MRVSVFVLLLVVTPPLAVSCAGTEGPGRSGDGGPGPSATSETTRAAVGQGEAGAGGAVGGAAPADEQAADAAEEAVELGNRFVEAANRGDAEGVAATFAPDARFDSIGRNYEGREEIMDRFLVPEVIDIGGRYEVLDVRREPDGAATFEFDFRAGSLYEHFTYRIVARDGEIQDVVGRYAR